MGFVEINEDSIRIYDQNNEEVVGWSCEEWEEDSSLVLSITNAIHLFYTEGIEYLKSILI